MRAARIPPPLPCDAEKDALARNANARLVIRVSVPIDVGTIAATESSVFAHATPIRADRLVALAVLEALGPRAPQDKRARALRTTLAGFFAGLFAIEVDGRIVRDCDATIVCGNVATLRFFAKPGEFAA